MWNNMHQINTLMAQLHKYGMEVDQVGCIVN